MRHKKNHRRLGVNSSQRKALLRSLCISLAEHGQIDTTVARAKEVQRAFEKLITLGRKGDLASKKIAYKKISNKKSVKKIFNEYADKFKDRNGGYTRILKLNNRLGDNAPMARIMLVGQGELFNIHKEDKIKEPPKKTKDENTFTEKLKGKLASAQATGTSKKKTK